MSNPRQPNPPRVGVLTGTHAGGAAPRAASLASELGLQVVEGRGDGFDFLFVIEDGKLALQDAHAGTSGPIYADFLKAASDRSRGPGGGRRQPIARAVGISGDIPSVFDATAGMGRDAFRLAMLGCPVTACERSPIVAALLRDGLERARTIPRLDDIITNGFELVVADARVWLSDIGMGESPDVVFLDPMFPLAAHASALVKKEMRTFRRLIGDDDDAAELLDAAREVARRRVVVKRMRHAPPLHSDVDITFKGKITRYDVYLVGGATNRFRADQ